MVDTVVARRLEDAQTWRAVRYAQAQAKLRPETQSAAAAAGDGHAVFAGVASPVNGVRGLGMRRVVEPQYLEKAEAFYSGGASITRIYVCPLADGSLLRVLCERAYRLEGFMNVLARSLDDSCLAYRCPPGVTISEVSVDQADLWLRVSAQGFSGQENPPPVAIDVLGPNIYAQAATSFLAWVDGEPAGAAGMFVHEGCVELGGASTRLPFRQRGVHGALLAARLAAARRMGCDLAQVGTSPGSAAQRNIERAGFSVAYTRAIVVKQQDNLREVLA